jgi:hypothetical protein
VLKANGVDAAAAGPVYARALALSGIGGEGPLLDANVWGFMYYADERGGDAYGPLGAHLVAAGDSAIPELVDLLGDTRRIFYEGSQEATLGAALGYRVNDAAAFYIGKIAGVSVPFHDEPAERDAEFARLRATLE